MLLYTLFTERCKNIFVSNKQWLREYLDSYSKSHLMCQCCIILVAFIFKEIYRKIELSKVINFNKL